MNDHILLLILLLLFFLFLLVDRPSSKKPKAPSNWIGMNFERNIPPVDMRWVSIWCHTFKVAAITSFDEKA